MSQILVIDDERSIRNTLKEVLEYKPTKNADIFFKNYKTKYGEEVIFIDFERFSSSSFILSRLLNALRSIRKAASIVSSVLSNLFNLIDSQYFCKILMMFLVETLLEGLLETMR